VPCKGEAGTGDASNAVIHMRTLRAEIRRLTTLAPDELYVAATFSACPQDMVPVNGQLQEPRDVQVVLFEPEKDSRWPGAPDS
jgi:pyridoxal 5'-phosphate synthase pdxS subunit